MESPKEMVNVVKASNSKMCFWDKHEFTYKGVQCPIIYKNRQIVRKKKEYFFNQNISRFEDVKESNENIYKIIPEEIYYDDMFCSYQCCIAWIDDNNYNPKYKNSKQILLQDMRYKGVKLSIKANHWKLLDKFGGFLTIEKFRQFDTFYQMDSTSFEDFSQVDYYKEKIQTV